jgi:hypothetical protein
MSSGMRRYKSFDHYLGTPEAGALRGTRKGVAGQLKQIAAKSA